MNTQQAVLTALGRAESLDAMLEVAKPSIGSNYAECG